MKAKTKKIIWLLISGIAVIAMVFFTIAPALVGGGGGFY